MATGARTSLGYSNDTPDTQNRSIPPTRDKKSWQKFWTKEMSAADKRLRDFTRRGNQIDRRYKDDRGNRDTNTYETGTDWMQLQFRLNLFHTNVSTLLSMLYGQTPRTDVTREHQDPDDDIGRVASNIIQRMLEADFRSASNDVPLALRTALQDRLLPGIGVCRVRYDLQTTNKGNGSTFQSEGASIEYVHWQDFRWGWGRTWTEIPWIGLRSWLTKEEFIKRFGKANLKNVTFENQIPQGDKTADVVEDKEQQNSIRKVQIWEIWNKVTKEVFWWTPGPANILDIKKDMYQLDNFWPVAMPMAANLTSTNYMPTADFILAQDLYNQVDILQTRISIVTRAVKVVGTYDASQKDVKRMLKEGVENDLIPVDNWAAFSEKGGLKGAVDWYPFQEVVGVLQTLRQVLGETIELLYQVTGMSDILRGANTDQYTSDGTQQLKAKFGSIRVQALQDEFARFASDLEALKAELIAKHCETETILRQSNAVFLPVADQDKIPAAIALIKHPQVKWRIAIKPESISMVDYAQLKSERTEFLTALATYIQSAATAGQAVPQSLPLLLELMKWGMAGFKGSEYLEGTMDDMIEMAKDMPQQPDQNQQAQQEAEQAQMEHQMEMEKIQAKAQADIQVFMTKMQGEINKIRLDNDAKVQQQLLKTQGDLEKIRVDLQADLRVIAAKLGADISTEQAQAENAAAEAQVEHENTLVEGEQDHINTLEEMAVQHELSMDQMEQQSQGQDDAV